MKPARILVGLTTGLAIGAGLTAAGVPAGPAVSIAEIVGGLWLDALRMTIVPLVFSLLVTGVVAAAGTAALGGIAARAVLWFGALLLASALLSAIVTPLLLGWTPVDPTDASALRAGAGGDGRIPATLPMSEWAKGIIPANPVAAAAEGAMLQLVVFALLFGLGVTRIGPELRERLSGFLQAVGDTMLVIVHWVLVQAPLSLLAGPGPRPLWLAEPASVASHCRSAKGSRSANGDEITARSGDFEPHSAQWPSSTPRQSFA